MLSIRFVRKGKKHHPLYRLIVQDRSKNPQSDYLEDLGTYNPHTKEKIFHQDRVTHWLNQGAQPTETVHNLLIDQGLLKAEKVRASKSRPGKKKAAELAAKKAEEAKQVQAAEAEAAAKTAAETQPAEPTTETPAAPATETKPAE